MICEYCGKEGASVKVEYAVETIMKTEYYHPECYYMKFFKRWIK